MSKQCRPRSDFSLQIMLNHLCSNSRIITAVISGDPVLTIFAIDFCVCHDTARIWKKWDSRRNCCKCPPIWTMWFCNRVIDMSKRCRRNGKQCRYLNWVYTIDPYGQNLRISKLSHLMTKPNKVACAPSKDSDEPGHPPSLIWRVFAVRMKKHSLAKKASFSGWVLSYLLSTQRRVWSDWADAQADLSLCWVHSYFVGFVMKRLKLLSV